MGSRQGTSASKILHNSFWYGLETIFETVVFFGTTIAVARYLGPTKLGYFSFINFFVTIVTRTGGAGLATATRKYMSEYLALGKPGTARAVYHLAFKYQLLGSTLITAVGLGGVFLYVDPHFRLMSSLLVLSMLPGIMTWVPAHANQAFEDVSKNTFSAFCYILSYTAVIILTLTLHWDLVGVASAMLVGRTVEVLLRVFPLHAMLRTMPLDVLDADLKRRVRDFCLQAIGVQLLMSVVWDRSEMVFLKIYCSLEQIAFYSVSFGLATNLLVIPRTFGSAAGITLMVEATREPGRIKGIVASAVRYLLLVVFPVHLGAAAITVSAIALAYGPRYAAAAPVLIIASLLAIPRAFQEIPEVLIRAADRQKQLLLWYAITGVVNIGLDWYLIPRYGAVGAAWGNGLSQTFGIVAIWQQARRLQDFSFPVLTALRLFLAGGVMAALAWFLARSLPGSLGLITAILAAIPTYILMVRLVRGLEPSDRKRLEPIANRLPGPARKPFQQVIDFVTPPAAEKA